MEDDITFDMYLIEVVKQANGLGFSYQQVLCFLVDIRSCYEGGVSVEDCVEEQF